MFPLSGHTCYYILEKEKKAFPSSTKFVVNTYVDNFSLGKINEAPFFSKSPYILLLPPSIRLLIREAGLKNNRVGNRDAFIDEYEAVER